MSRKVAFAKRRVFEKDFFDNRLLPSKTEVLANPRPLATKKELLANQSAYVAQFYPNQNFGSPPSLYFGQYLQRNDDYRTLLKFPLNLCPNKDIVSAILELTISRNEVPSGVVVNAGLQRALQPWEQLSVTWNTQPLFSPISTFPITSSTTIGTVISIDVTTVVRSWLTGTSPNFGFIITGDERINSIIGINNVHVPIDVKLSSVDPFGVLFKEIEDEHLFHDFELEFDRKRVCSPLAVELFKNATGSTPTLCTNKLNHKHKKHRHHKFERDHKRFPDIFVQDPFGSLNFVDATTVIRRIDRPKLIIKFVD